jgi:UDP-N-acetylmuramoyl-L-alanyl-D-glutamate--2,6-diaminopimelate ligase
MEKTKRKLPDIYPVTCNTKRVGEGSTFVAIKGYKVDGAQFVEEAIARGATQIIVEDVQDALILSDFFLKIVSKDERFFKFVKDTREALAELSAAAFNYPAKNLKFIGITGTKGKTTTAFLIEYILRSAGKKTALIGTIKNKINNDEYETDLTTPNSDYLHMFFNECVKQKVEYVVMEVSSHAVLTKRVHGIEFDAICFTNLSPEHMDFHRTMQHYFEAKTKLFDQLKSDGSIVINLDDEWGKKAAEKFLPCSNIISISLQKNECRNNCPALIGMFNEYNVLMAEKTCVQLQVKQKTIKQALKKFVGVPGRLQKCVLKNGAVAFVDFAHNPSSFDSVLQTLRAETDHLIIVFGCGGDRDKTKRPKMGKIAEKYGDEIIITDDNPRGEDHNKIISEICDGISKKELEYVECEPDRKKAIACAVKKSRIGSIIALLGKGHETYYIVKNEKIFFDDFQEISRY